MSSGNQPFHNPTDFGCWDLLTSQENQALPFVFDTAVLNDSTVVITYRDKPIKTYTTDANGGLTISNGGLTITLEIDGATFGAYAGNVLKGHCEFFESGTVHITFELNIIESPLSSE